MRIVINHLTRMAPGYICVAGVVPHSGQHVRPVLMGRLPRELLICNGGPFDMAVTVDLGPVEAVGAPPEVEDHRFSRWMAHAAGSVAAAEFWTLLSAVSHRRLNDSFGPELRRTGYTCAIEAGKGKASLGCLLPSGRPRVARDSYGKLRVRVVDGVFDVSIPVTDLRLFKTDHTTIREEVVADLNARIDRGTRVVLSVGLSREYARSGDAAAHHWLQVNGLHLEDNPVWQVGG